MKRFVLLIISVIGTTAAALAEEQQAPSGTFVFSDDENYFGRLTVSRDGAITGMMRDTFGNAEFGRFTFRGTVSLGGEANCKIHVAKPSYYSPFGPSFALTLRHTPEGP